MSWGATAVAGATLVSGYMSSQSADKASKDAAKASKAQLAFEKAKYEDWKATYGDIEQNLSEYYSQLTPDFYAVQGLEAFQKEQEATHLRIKTSLAQRGISESSGLALAMEQELEQQGAEERARIRALAPSAAAEEQRQFLQVGLGQNPGAGVSQTLAQRTQAAQQQATLAQQQAQAGTQAAVSAVGTTLTDYLNRPTTPPDTTSSLPQSYVSTTPQQTVDYTPYA